MNIVVINPSKIKTLGLPVDTHFCLVTNTTINDQITIVEEGGYLTYSKVFFEPGQSFETLIKERIPTRAHVLVISPHVFFRSPPQEALGKQRKLMAMACNSTPTDIDAIKHFVKIIEDTDPEVQQAMANKFFEIAEQAQYLEFIDEVNQTYARFEHLDENYLWNEQAGILNDGEQQLAPAGEISVLPLEILDFDDSLRLNFTGSIALNGPAILHGGNASQYSRLDQIRLYQSLNTMADAAVIAEVEQGIITHIHAKSEQSAAACQVLNNMFNIDSRYRILWEIGFGINTANKILTGNHAMNETFGNTAGAIHFGLGITPFTQFHLDTICPNMKVLTNTGQYLINSKKTELKRQKSASCGCAS
jgi:hypothetical protein